MNLKSIALRQGRQNLATRDHLNRLMARFRVQHLVDETRNAFHSRLMSFLDIDDYAMEDLASPQRQRDLTVKFHWGHDHDFGSFRLEGKMGDRHLQHLATFIEQFQALPLDLTGRRILEIGCWTGGASLLMSAMGAEVTAIDEVKKYTECLTYLKRAFGLDQLTIRHASLYDLDHASFWDRFDHVLFAGVLYHVTDPIVALRIVFNALKDGGTCLLESTAFRSRLTRISFSRRRWNWFDMSPSALKLMMQDVGFQPPQLGAITTDRRIYAVAKRTQHVDMRRDGLSKRDLR